MVPARTLLVPTGVLAWLVMPEEPGPTARLRLGLSGEGGDRWGESRGSCRFVVLRKGCVCQMKRRFKLTGASIAALVATVVIAMVVSPLSSGAARGPRARSEEHTSELQSRENLV